MTTPADAGSQALGARPSSAPGTRHPVSAHVTRWRQIADGMRNATRRHHSSILAGGVAFYAFLSMFPALAALVSGYGLLADAEHVRRQVDMLAGGLPPTSSPSSTIRWRG